METQTFEKLARKVSKIVNDDCGMTTTPSEILAWMKHEDEDDLVSKSPKELAEIYECG